LLPNDFSLLFREPADENHVRTKMLSISKEKFE